MTAVPPASRLALCLAIGLAAGCHSGRAEGPVSAGPKGAVAPSSQEGLLAQAREHFYRAVDGDDVALSECEKSLAALAPQDPKAKAYRGACAMLRAKRARLPWEKGDRAKAGLALLDNAVSAAPLDLEVRFVRGMSCYNLPTLFNRSALAARDLAEVANRAEEASADGTLEPALAAASLFYSGVIQADAGDRSAAVSLWRRAVALAPASRAAQRATHELATP